MSVRSSVEALVHEGIDRMIVGLPFVRCRMAPGGQLRVQYITRQAASDSQETSDWISSWLPCTAGGATFSLERVLFSVDAILNRSFVFVDALVHPDPSAIDLHFKDQHPLLQTLIEKTLLLPPCFRTILALLSLSSHTSDVRFRHGLVRWLVRYPPVNHADVLIELQRLIHTSDIDFMKIRTPSHLLALIRSLVYLKEQLTFHAPSGGHDKQLVHRLFPARLQVPFGTKEVMCLAICVRPLSPYERFDDRHILLACQRCIPSLEAVPRSFYASSSPAETALSLYLELEKSDRSAFTCREMKTLKDELGLELTASIEQVMSRIDIPLNEEDLLRNLLLLSQQVRSVKDRPQIIIQFQGQSDTSLAFHVTLVRCTKDEEAAIPMPEAQPATVSRCLLLRSSTIEKIHRRLIKQGLMFLIECPKERFLRRDRSVDFLRARGCVVEIIESAYGKVRDLNGGLSCQHHQVLATLRPLLAEHELKELSLVEDLLHSLSPASMKPVLGPEHIATLFRQLLCLRAEMRKGQARPFLVEEYAKEMFIGLHCPKPLVKEPFFQDLFPFQAQEQAHCSSTVDGHHFCFLIFLCQDSERRRQLQQAVRDRLYRKPRLQRHRSFRMSLPRPTFLLDPRIGADRTSGAIIKLLYEGLMRLDSGDKPSLAIAKEVSISEDLKRYSFTLRDSCWSNGQPVTAYDFEYAWKTIVSPYFRSHFDFLFFPILNARLVKAGRLTSDELGVHAIDAHQLVVDLEKPNPHFLELCSLWIYSPLWKDIDTTYPGWAYFGDKKYVCNGPFTLKRASRTGDLHLQRNDRYWDSGRVCLETIDISIIENPKKALQLFAQGELDWIGDPLSEVPLKGSSTAFGTACSKRLSAVHVYMLNTHHPLFRSSKIRHAFSQALPRQEVVEQFLYGDERLAHSILSGSLSLVDPAEPLPYDPANARRLFAEGCADESLCRSLLKPLKMAVFNKEPYKSIARYVADAWAKTFNLTITVEPCSWEDFLDDFSSASHDILGTLWYSWYQDPSYSMGIFSNARHHFNASRWSSEEMRELLDRAEQERDLARRRDYLGQAERLLMAQMPMIPVCEASCRYLHSEHVDNLHVSPIGNVELSWATFRQP